MGFRKKIHLRRFWWRMARKLFVLAIVFSLGGFIGFKFLVEYLEDQRIISYIAYDVRSPGYNRSNGFLQNIRKRADINLEKIAKDTSMKWHLSRRGENIVFAGTTENMKGETIGILFSSYPQVRDVWRRFYGGYVFTQSRFRSSLRVYTLQIFDEDANSIIVGEYVGYDSELSQKNLEQCCFFYREYNIPILEELFNLVKEIATKE